MSRQRVMAIVALIAAAALLLVAVASLLEEFPEALFALACLPVAAAAGFYGLRRRGRARALGAVLAVLALSAAVALLVLNGLALEGLAMLVGMALFLAASRVALRLHVSLPRAPAPARPVLFVNPRSGGGKAERLSLASEARARGIEPI